MSDHDARDRELNETDGQAEPGTDPEVAADEPLDLGELDPEAWRPGIPWWPGFSLIFAVVALPAISIWLSGVVADRLAREAPDQLGAIDAWRGLIQASLIVGVILIVMVPIAARLVQGDTNAILRVLEVGFPVGVTLVVVVVLLHTVLAFAIVMGVERLIFGHAFPGTAGVVALAGLASAVYLLTAALGKLRASTDHEFAVPIDRPTAPGLFALIDDLARGMGITPPDAVLVGPSMAFWSATGTFKTLTEPVSGNVLVVSLPAMALLSRAQIEALLAHELAHFRNRDMEVNSRLGPGFDRIVASVRALDQESEGVGRIAAWPGRLWLDFATRAMSAVVGERRRASEASADDTAAAAVGEGEMASALVGHAAIHAVEVDWAGAVRKAVEWREGDPLDGLPDLWKRGFAETTARDVIEWTLADLEPDRPALLTRLRARGHADVGLDVMTDPAIRELLADPAGVAARLWDAMRDFDTRGESIHLNPPRATPGVIGWVLTGLVFVVIFAVRGIGSGEWLQIAVVITAVWLLFPVVYPYLQREAELDRAGFRTRPWWFRWVDPSATRLPWSQLRWTGTMWLKLRAESWATLSNGLDSTSWWAGIWSKQELGRLIDALRERGAAVDFSSLASVQDVERHAVIWYVRGRFLVPELRVTPEGTFVTVQPVKSLGTGALKLSFALTDRLYEPVPLAKPTDVVVQTAHLAAAAKVDVETFEREARRAEIHGDREDWSMTIDGIEGEWRVPRTVDELDMAEVLVEILHDEPETEAETDDEPDMS
jgi:Zn-dependent protease with chaperone function